jgi:hypothetical protein
MRRFWSAPAPAAHAPFSRRLVIQSLLPLQPFFFNDIMFMGLARDLRRLVTFDLWYELEHALLNTEQIFHFEPFRQTVRATRLFLRVNPGLEHGDNQRSRAIYAMLLEHELYLRALAESLLAVEDAYILGWDEMEDWQGEDRSLCELIQMPYLTNGRGLWMSEKGNNLWADHPATVPFLLDRPISQGDRRTLRALASVDLPDLGTLEAQATMLVQRFAGVFRDLPNPPRFPFNDGPLHIIPPRIQRVVVN